MKQLVNQLKTPFLTILMVLVLLYVFTALFGPIPFSVKSTTTTTSDLFTVSGMGEEKAVPDSSQFSVGVTANAATVEAATQQVNTNTNKIIEQLKGLGIEEKDIKTQNFSSYPNYDSTPVRSLTTSSGPESLAMPVNENIASYTVSQDLLVTTKSVELANQALDAAIANGANQISGVTFTINDEDKKVLQQKARKKAIDDAKSKAQDIAKDAGIKLGKVVNIYVADNQGMMPMMYEQKAMSSAGDMAAPVNLQPGENTVRVDVTLSYETL